MKLKKRSETLTWVASRTAEDTFRGRRAGFPMNYLTADLIDAHDDKLQSCDMQFRQYGGRQAFHGPVRTVLTREDNALVRTLFGQPGQGAVLVIDGGGSLRTALMGDVLAKMAAQNGWAGVVIHGAVRDTQALGQMDFGVKALGSNPRKSAKNATGSVDVPVTFGGV